MLVIHFFLALIATLFAPLFFPFLRFFTFAPFLASFFQKKAPFPSACVSLGCGCLVDLLSTHSPFGLFALTYLFSTFSIYPIRRYFFENRIWSLAFYTFLFSIPLSLFYALFLLIWNSPFAPPFSEMLLSSFFAPFMDGLYAFLWFTIPQKFCSLILNIFSRVS